MTEIPEHLLKRAQAAREKAAESAPAESAAADAGAPAAADSPGDSRIPAHLLERSKSAKQKAAGGEAASSGGGVAVAEKVAAVVQATPGAGGVPIGAGPGGHTQRLLTVVKSGSIQDVKAQPVD